jgi:hypothetical protein
MFFAGARHPLLIVRSSSPASCVMLQLTKSCCAAPYAWGENVAFARPA